LRWTGKTAGPVIYLPGPSRATLRDLHIVGGKVAEGIVLDNCDQPGSRIFGEQISIEGGNKTGLFTEKLDHANIELHDFYHSGNENSIKVVGGPLLAAGKPAEGRVAIFGGGSANNDISYDLQDGGNLLVWDMWYETGQKPRFINLTGAGTLTLNGANEAVAVAAGVPPLEVNNFNGKVTLMGLEFTTTSKLSNKITIAGEGTNTRVLLLGNSCRDSGEILNNTSPKAQVAFLNNRKMSGDNKGSVDIPNVGPSDNDFLRGMFAQLRTELPRPLDDLQPGVTDARFFRIFVSETLTGMHLKAGR
jgi:hypothetical protein